MNSEIFLFFDDTGSREPDHSQKEKRQDGMDCFGFGGILIKEEDIDALISAHNEFCKKWRVDYPLHSSPIRSGRGKFGWLKKHHEQASLFFADLEKFLISLPVIGIATVIDRNGYVNRYHEQYQGEPWRMCKTACAILIERAAKYASSQNRHLRIFFEQSGKKEDKIIKNYVSTLKKEGMPFDRKNSQGYDTLTIDKLQHIIRGEPRERTKKTAMIQVADLYLYPMAKAGYDSNYQPYQTLMKHKKLIDTLLTPEEIAQKGIKYSCFDKRKN